MSIEDTIVELKLKQRDHDKQFEDLESEKEDRAKAEAERNKAIDYRFDTMQRLIDEQNEFLASISKQLTRLSNQFQSILTKADKWVQRIIGATASILIAWVFFSDAPLDKIKWLLEFIK